MNKIEELALKEYPVVMTTLIPADNEHSLIEQDCNKFTREAYIKGYHQAEEDLTDKAKLSSGWDGFYYGQGYKQAEKDLELSWKDIELIVNIDKDTDNEESVIGVRKNEEHYKEVLKRFKE